MTQKTNNIFQQATELVSLDCSSILEQNTTLSHNMSQYLHQSILNLKTVLPTFNSEFTLFKEEIIQMSYFIVNKLMAVIKTKNMQISKLQDDLQKSQYLNNGTKKEVIQLKQMITDFMQTYKKQINVKEKQIAQKQKQLDSLKNVIQQNFNSPRNLCQNCQVILNTNSQNQFSLGTQEAKQEVFNNGNKFQIDSFFQNYSNSKETLVQMSQSIVCNNLQLDKRMSLEIIQEEASDINSLTDYLQSQRCSQNQDKQNTEKYQSEFNKSSRSGQIKESDKEVLYTGNRSHCQGKNSNKDLKSYHYLSECDKTVKGNSPLGKINILSNLQQNRPYHDTFSSRITNKNYQNQNLKPENQRQRRCSEHFMASNSIIDGYRIQRKSIERSALSNKMIQNLTNMSHLKQQVSLKAQLEQISKSSSSSDIMHFGDTDKINVNLPKKFESPKNMNFVKKNSSRKEPRQERLKTQPSPRNSKFHLNKENINTQYQSKPIQMGRKIFARKKMIMTHAKASNTSRMESKKQKQQNINSHIAPIVQNDIPKQKQNLIEIKYIESPEKEPSKSSHLIKPSVSTIFASVNYNHQVTPHMNNYMDYSSVSSNISSINESNVKSHHIYHSTGKYKSQSTPKNINKVTMTPGKSHSKNNDRKSCSKSKQKLKVTSKSNNQETSLNYNFHFQSKKQKFLSEMNQNCFTSNNQSISKIKNKNLSVHIGCNNKIHLKQNLVQIKHALINYCLPNYFNGLKEVFFDGKIINGQKQGYGKIVYDNGMIYDGELRKGKKQGEAKITLNGIDIYEGQFTNDNIEGQGYLKFLRYFTNINYCPKVLQEASYFGRFTNNNFDGMGTLFLNHKQKIVTKFSNGIPYGQLTFYTQNEIQFGHWPSD